MLEHESRSRLISNFRGLAFGLAVIALGFALFRAEASFLFGVSIILGIAFLLLVVLHARVIAREEDARRFLWVNEAAEKRVTDAFRSLPDDGSAYAVENHPYADDIDILGPGSLFQRLCVAHTRFGQATLAQWLLKPATSNVIAERQEVVKALAPKLALRQQLEAESLLVAGMRSGKPTYKPPVDPEPLLAWAEGATQLLNKSQLSWVAIFLPLLTLTLFALSRTLGWAPVAWLVPAALQVGLAFALGPAANRVFGSVSSTEGAFVRYGGMLALLDSMGVGGKFAEKWRAQTTSEGISASLAMKEFRSRLGWFDLKHNGLIYPFVNLIFLWDINCTLALERWQRRFGSHVRGWFEAIGEFEALSSLAGFLYDEHGFVFPEVEPGFSGFLAEGLGHPLISPDKRVVNDVALPSGGTALLVTGSNMSGKSTLLRSMGLSTVLALAGGPVCAQRLRMGTFSLHTSMRVRDSLQSGVSHFYAELRKLKSVVEAAQAKENNVFFLLDEILHGTNSKERQLGARWVMSELIQLGATGAVSTHDLELCQLPPDQMGRVELVHLRENVENGQMVFDFKVRKGPVTEGNALRLMRLLGLAVPLVDEPR
ncbi:MAG: DNA mismatch repair protein MutS [Polyangiaceae bacterium]|nr:DNA mismatch repair protein MutS [Polyangiaceae bacterium]